MGLKEIHESADKIYKSLARIELTANRIAAFGPKEPADYIKRNVAIIDQEVKNILNNITDELSIEYKESMRQMGEALSNVLKFCENKELQKLDEGKKNEK